MAVLLFFVVECCWHFWKEINEPSLSSTDMEAEKYLPFKSCSMKLTQAIEGNNHVAGAISIISEACEQWPWWFAVYRATNQPINQQTQASSPFEGGLDVGLQWVWIATIARGESGGWFALRISRDLKSQQWPRQDPSTRTQSSRRPSPSFLGEWSQSWFLGWCHVVGAMISWASPGFPGCSMWGLEKVMVVQGSGCGIILPNWFYMFIFYMFFWGDEKNMPTILIHESKPHSTNG